MHMRRPRTYANPHANRECLGAQKLPKRIRPAFVRIRTVHTTIVILGRIRNAEGRIGNELGAGICPDEEWRDPYGIEARVGNETRIGNLLSIGNAEAHTGKETSIGTISGRLFEGSRDRGGSKDG